jgi:hypothetical protein
MPFFSCAPGLHVGCGRLQPVPWKLTGECTGNLKNVESMAALSCTCTTISRHTGHVLGRLFSLRHMTTKWVWALAKSLKFNGRLDRKRETVNRWRPSLHLLHDIPTPRLCFGMPFVRCVSGRHYECWRYHGKLLGSQGKKSESVEWRIDGELLVHLPRDILATRLCFGMPIFR